jgi:hypothetical protein
MAQTQAANPFRPGSGILPPLLACREREAAIFETRMARTCDGHPQHTALLGEWAIGKTTLLLHWRHLPAEADDVVVLSMRPLVANGHVDRVAAGARGRLLVRCRLFRRFRERADAG